MGGKPLFALNIVGYPINDLPKSILTEILQGGADKAQEAGIPIVGGHSIDDKEPKYGLVVTGEVEESKMNEIVIELTAVLPLAFSPWKRRESSRSPTYLLD